MKNETPDKKEAAIHSIDEFMDLLEEEIEEIRKARRDYDADRITVERIHAKLKAFDAAYTDHRRLISRIEKQIERIEKQK